MIMAPVTTERIAAPIYLPVRPAAEVIGEWREDSLFIEPDKTRNPSDYSGGRIRGSPWPTLWEPPYDKPTSRPVATLLVPLFPSSDYPAGGGRSPTATPLLDQTR